MMYEEFRTKMEDGYYFSQMAIDKLYELTDITEFTDEDIDNLADEWSEMDIEHFTYLYGLNECTLEKYLNRYSDPNDGWEALCEKYDIIPYLEIIWLDNGKALVH